jgi:hypothetical protein
MSSAAQIAANRVNAQLSTGPVTLEGKVRSSQNALRHGLTAKHLVIRDDEREEFAAFQQDLLDELAPQGATEILTFQDLLHAAWNLHRFRRIEAELSTGAADDFSGPNTAALDRLSRYQSRAQREYYRALKELRILQTNRALRAVKLEDPADPEIPVIADINELTKRSHAEVQAEGIEQACRMLDLEAGLLVRDTVAQRRSSVTEKPRS